MAKPTLDKSLAASYKRREQSLRTHETTEEQITKLKNSSEGIRLVRRHYPDNSTETEMGNRIGQHMLYKYKLQIHKGQRKQERR